MYAYVLNANKTIQNMSINLGEPCQQIINIYLKQNEVILNVLVVDIVQLLSIHFEIFHFR